MPFNGSGGFTIINTFVPGTTILSSAVNQNYSDLAITGLSNCLTKDGQQTWGANQKAGGFVLTGLGSGTAAGNSVEWQQWQNTSLQPGMMMDWGGTNAPSLWYFCYGQAVSRTTYSALYANIGTAWGSGDGATTFNLPDLRGRVSAGVDNMGGTAAGRIGTVSTDSGTITGTTVGSTGGSSTHVQATGELATHTPSGSVAMSGTQDLGNLAVNAGGTAYAAGTGLTFADKTVNFANASATFTGNPVGSSTAMAWLQPTMMVNKIIFANA